MVGCRMPTTSIVLLVLSGAPMGFYLFLGTDRMKAEIAAQTPEVLPLAEQGSVILRRVMLVLAFTLVLAAAVVAWL